MLSRKYNNYKCMNVIIDPIEGQGALWLGDYPAAVNQKLQKENNIKTILTIAGGLKIKPDSQIVHKIYNISDNALCNIKQIWGDTFSQIEEGLKRGSVLVHCRAGVSRSASTIIAYLMKKNNLSYQQAIEFVKLKRSVVSPNLGFQKQLKEYENLLGNLTQQNEIFQNQNQVHGDLDVKSQKSSHKQQNIKMY